MPDYSFGGGSLAAGQVISPATLAADAASGATSLVFTSVPSPAPAIGMPITGQYIPGATTISAWNIGTKTATISTPTTGIIKTGVVVYIVASASSGGAISASDMDNLEYIRAANVRVFTSNAIYNPTVGTRYCEVEMVGAGGGIPGYTSNTNSYSMCSGGASGSYIRVMCLPSEIWGQQITVGLGTSGGNGGSSSIGSLILAPGGVSGGQSVQSANVAANTIANTAPTNPPVAATSTVGAILATIQGQGAPLNVAVCLSAGGGVSMCTGSAGGSNPLGVGGVPGTDYGLFARLGSSGTGYGSGCGSSSCANGGTALAKAGQNGVDISTEYF